MEKSSIIRETERIAMLVRKNPKKTMDERVEYLE
jgi:hypothetical protein